MNEPYYLVVTVKQSQLDPNKINVTGKVRKLLHGGKSAAAITDKLYLDDLECDSYVRRNSDTWHWEFYGLFNMNYAKAYCVGLELSRMMLATLTAYDREYRKICASFGSPANIGQAMTWAMQAIGASGIAIYDERQVTDLGWYVYKAAEAASVINRLVLDIQQSIERGEG